MNWSWLLSITLWFYAIALIGLSLRILLKRRAVGSTLAWLLFLYILPFLGIVFYLLFGERYLGRLRAKRAKQQFEYYSLWLKNIFDSQLATSTNTSPLSPVMELAARSIGMPVVKGNQWQVFSDAQHVFEALIKDINQASESIFFEFYIVEAKGNVEPVLTALALAAQRGVAVYMMLDSVGSNAFLNSSMPKELSKHGVKILDVLHANFLRMSLRRQDLRQHRKLISIDNKIAYTGSMNLVDPSYFKTRSGVGPWVDIMVRLTGDISVIIQGTLIYDWEMETGIRLEKHLGKPAFLPTKESNLMQILPSGPSFDEDILLQALLTAIHNARKSVIITTPYFVPDEALMQALKSAAKRGITVTIILPRKNDSKLAQYAGQSFYQELMNVGVSLKRFEGGLLHSKTVVIDEHLVLVGSVNLDMRSIWLNFESTLIVDDEHFCKAIMLVIKSYESKSKPLELVEWKKRSYLKRAFESLAQLASPLL